MTSKKMLARMTADNGGNLGGVQSGQLVQISSLKGGRQFLSRLASLGFTPGAKLQVIQNYGHGPIIVRLRDTRVALGRGEAERILVQRFAGVQDA